jgi:hypothetical protein
MTVRYANIKGVKFIEEPRGDNGGILTLVTFDLDNQAYTGGTDTVSFGGGGYENEVATTLSLAVMLQNRRRDGRTVTIAQAMGGWYGQQSAATNGPNIYVQSPTVSGGNITSVTLFNAATGGSAITCAASAWQSAGALILLITADYASNNPE